MSTMIKPPSNRRMASDANRTVRNNDSRLRSKKKQKEAVKNFTHDEFMAAAIGDTAWLKQSLKDGKDTSRFDPNGLSALHLAALHGRLECLKFLAESCDVDVNLESSTGWRALHLAINSRTGKRGIECLQYLLSRGADPSVFNDDLLTPCHQAAIEGSAKSLEALIAAGADINLKDCKGHTPLDYAKIWGHRICARLLAAEGWKKDKAIQAQQIMKMKFHNGMTEEEALLQQESKEAEREFYGSISFSNWLEEKGLPRKPTGPETLSECHHKRSKSVSKEKVHKPNSKCNPASSNALPLKLPQMESNRTITPSKKITSSSKTKATAAKMMMDKSKTGEIKGIRDMLMRSAIESPSKSVKKSPQSSDSEEEVSEYPQYMIDRLWLERMSMHNRPLNFKCQNIIDAQHRKLLDESQKPLVETYAHLSDCIESSLFPRPEAGQGMSRESSDFDANRVANAIKSWSNPGRFPAIKGSDYTYGFEAQ